MDIILWLIVAAVFLFVEIISLGLTSIWFSGGAFVSAIAAYFGASIWLQIVLFILVSAILVILTRPMAKKYLDNKIEKTNAEGLIGKIAIVTKEIDNNKSTGNASINGMEWTARSIDGQVISENEKVEVREIQGVKLIVEKVNGKSNI